MIVTDCPPLAALTAASVTHETVAIQVDHKPRTIRVGCIKEVKPWFRVEGEDATAGGQFRMHFDAEGRVVGSYELPRTF